MIGPYKEGPNGEQVPMQFRYTITPKTKVNAFKPRPVEGQGVDVRASQMGATFGGANGLPRTPNIAIVWEVRNMLTLHVKKILGSKN